ncbi:MAG: class I SAM-dependent methyltransferase [Anaerolineales bacterium]
MARRPFVSAAGVDWLLPLYDPFTRWLGVESAHRRLIIQADIHPGHRVLEIGCGTGNLATLLKRTHPGAEVVGLDPDPKALDRARRKAEGKAASVEFDLGFSEELPYPDASFDRVLSALMFHHLEPPVKKLALLEMRRVLRPGGSIHMVDLAAGEETFHGFLARIFHPSHGSRFSSADPVPALMAQTGFREASEVAHDRVLLGRIAYYRAIASASPGTAPA